MPNTQKLDPTLAKVIMEWIRNNPQLGQALVPMALEWLSGLLAKTAGVVAPRFNIQPATIGQPTGSPRFGAALGGMGMGPARGISMGLQGLGNIAIPGIRR